MNSTLYYFRSLVQRRSFAAVCLAIVVAFGGASWGLVLVNRAQSVRQRLRQEQGEAVLAALVQEQPLRQELATARSTNRRIQDNLVSESNLAENLWYFYRIEEQTKAHIEDLRPVTVPGAEGSQLFRKVPFTMRVTGTATQVAEFIQAVETGPRLTSVTNLSLRRRTPGSSAVSAVISLDMLGAL